MKLQLSLRLVQRRFLLIFLPLLTLASVIAMLFYYLEAKNAKEERFIFETSEVNYVKLQMQTIINDFKMIKSDLAILTSHHEMHKHHEGGEPHRKKALAEEFLLFCDKKGIYDQVRLLDEKGKEIVRVNYNSGNPYIVPEDQLQFKGDRYYFKDTFKLDEEEMFVSPFDLNIEGGRIEKPLKPMLRFGTTVFDRYGQKRGIVVLNYLGENLINTLKLVSVSAPGHIMLLNSDGYWLRGAKPEDEWGFMFEDRKNVNFGNDFPNAWQLIAVGESGHFYNKNGLFTFMTVYLFLEGWKSTSGSGSTFEESVKDLQAKEYTWKIVSHVVQDVLSVRLGSFTTILFSIYGAVIASIGCGSWFLANLSVRRMIAEEEVKGLAKFPDENPNPVIRVFDDGSILYHNKASLSLLDFWGCQTTRMLPDKYIKIVSDVLHSGLYNVTEAECNNRVMSLTFAPIAKERYVNIYGLDITERKNAEENIKVINESLEQRVVERTEKLRKKYIELLNEIAKREQTEEALRESEEKFREITSSAYNAIVMMDDEGKVSFWNEAAERMFGYSREEVAGKDLHALIVPDRYYDAFLKGMEGFRKDGTGLIINKTLVLPGLRKDGTEFPADHSFSSVKLKNKWHAISIMRDITERKRTEEQIKASLKEKEVLLNEVHHRVKNNLQIISSLLDLSSMQTQNQETIELFAESRNRVESMALIHSQLYESERFDEIDMERHIQELSGNLLNIYSKEKTITLDIKSTHVYLPVTQAIPCALVLNELISNSLKHAYRDGEQGTISISMQQSDDNTILMRVRDNGAGISEEIDIGRTKSLGLKLARNIVFKQLNGKIKIIRNKGTEFIVEFKNSKEDS
ncbi:MAG: PAS domain S-box protein [Candidatus Scalindua sp.]